MKKLILSIAIAFAAVCAQAAAVGWSVAAGNAAYGGDKYMFFIVGQNSVTSIGTVTALLDAGQDVSTYAYGSGNLLANGSATVLAANSGKSIDAGTYTSFAVIFDAAAPEAGKNNYVVVSGLANQTKSVSETAANVTFATGSAASIVNNSANWQSFGSAGPIAPEPTSGLLLLLGMAGLALKRKHA